MSDIRIPTLSCNTENTEPDSIVSEQLLEMTIQILQKPKTLRTPEDIKVLMKCTEDNQFIGNFIEKRGSLVHSELCQQFDYEYLKAGHTLFEMGSFGTTFYIILSGTVEVLVRDPTNKDPLKHNNMQTIAELTTGGSFGELAIIDSALRPRTATIKAKEHCHFLVLERKAFSKILGGEEKRKLEDTVEFFAANPVFKAWSTFALKSWGYIFRMQQTFLRNAVLYREGDKAEDIYLIKSGEVVCTKVITMHKRVKGEESLVLDDDDQVVSVAKASTVKSVEIAIFGPGELFGEEESYESYKVENERKLRELMPKNHHTKHVPTEEDLPRRETTMTVISSSAEIWKIPAKLFFSKMEVNSAAKQQLISVVTAKRKRRYQRIKEIQKNSVDYMKFLQKEQKGKRDVVSSFKSTKIDAFEKNLQQEAKELSDTFFKASQKGPSEQSNHWSVGSQNSLNSQDIERKKVLLLNRSSSAKVQKKRTNSLVGTSLEHTKKLMAKNQAPLAEIGELGSRSFLPNDSQDMRIEGKILENIDNQNITARSSNTETKSTRKAYSQYTTQIKLRLREKLLNGQALSKNDHLYGNFLKQYNMFHPDKIIDGLKREIQPMEAEDAARRMEDAKSIGNTQVDRLFKKNSVPALERVSSQPVAQVMGMDPAEINSLFKSRKKFSQAGDDGQTPVTERSKRLISEPTPEANRRKRISVTMRESPDSRNDETNSLVKKRVFVLREDNTLSCERFSKVAADKGPMARSSSVPKMDTAMNKYINNEIQRLQNKVQPDASQIRSRLFNYNLKQMYGGKPNGSKLLRALEIAKRSKSPDSPSRMTNLKKNFSTTHRKSLHEIMEMEFGRDSPERTRNGNWTAITIKRCSTARTSAEPA